MHASQLGDRNEIMQTDVQNDDGNDDDWEYEYDENETEEFYVTLDLTTYAPPLARKRTQESQQASDPPSQAAAVDPALSTTSNTSPALPSQQPLASPSTDPIQFLDLHTHNPIVSYQGNLYICTWASALGTDLLLSGPEETPLPAVSGPAAETDAPNSNYPSATPRKPQIPYTLHATTSLRLLAKPANTVPRPIAAQHPSIPGTSSGGAIAPVDHRTTDYIAPHRHAQTAFLARLATAKRARGDTDAVPVYTNVPNHQPPAVPAMVGTVHGRRRGGRRRGGGQKRARGNGRGGRSVGSGGVDPDDQEDTEKEDDEEEQNVAGGAEGQPDAEASPWGRSNRLRRKRRWTKRFEEALQQEAANMSDDADGAGARGEGKDADFEAPNDDDIEAEDAEDASSSGEAGAEAGIHGAA